MEQILYNIVPAIIMGMIARIDMLRVDSRQYPTYPQGVVSHLTLGAIAAVLGSVAFPSLLLKEFNAVTFLSLAAQQFRDVRRMERESLDNIEQTELVPRGTAYIEDISKAFEARNYMVIITSLSVSITIYLIGLLKLNIWIRIAGGIIIGFCVIAILKKMLQRTNIKDIAEIKPAKLEFEGSLLKINDIIIMNVGLESSKEIYLTKALAIEIIPKNANASITLSNIGQRQAILHNASIQLGIRKDVDEPDFFPMARRNHATGSIVIAIIPMHNDMDLLIKTVLETPVLESAKRKTKISEQNGDE